MKKIKKNIWHRCKQKQMIREINRVEIADAATKFLTRKIKIQPMEQ
jgi:hypothetical protein